MHDENFAYVWDRTIFSKKLDRLPSRQFRESRNSYFKILIADDDPDEQALLEVAAHHLDIPTQLDFVRNGEQLMTFLHGDLNKDHPNLPNLILLDLNMPELDGNQAIKLIRSHPALKQVPIIVMTVSNTPEDVYCSYTLGANTHISKPNSFDSVVTTLQAIVTYWFNTAQLPPTQDEIWNIATKK